MRLIKALRYFFLFVWYKNIVKSRKFNDIIYDGARDLGGIYVKLLQFVALRTDVFDISQRVRFISFYDQASIEDFDIRNYLNRELGKNAEEIVELEEKPFASGTFGQVYKGRLKSGEEIIVKAKKAGQEEKIRSDFFLLNVLGFLFNLFFEQKMVDVKGLIQEFKQITFKELDYKSEVENAIEFYQIYRNHENIFIPKTYSSLSTKNIIIQDYVGGVALSDLIRFKEEGGDHRVWLKENLDTDIDVVLPNISYEILIQGFVHPKYYGDPHPGNVKILRDNKIAFIDFGIAEVPPRGMKNYYRIIKNFAKEIHEIDWEDLGNNFIELGSPDFYHHIESFDNHFGGESINLKKAIIENYGNLTTLIRGKYYKTEAEGKQDFLGIMLDMTKLGEKFGVIMPGKMFSALRSFFMFKNYAQYLEPNLHFSRRNFQRVLAAVPEYKVIDDFQKRPDIIEESLEKIFDWVGTVAEADMGLYRKIEANLGRA